MRAADARALASTTQDQLVRRAGWAVAAEALSMLGGAYGRRVVVVAGKGNNGNDGRVAAAVLAVDIPSGVHGDTGAQSGRALAAERTVTLAALKPGLLMGEGAELAGTVSVADIGVPTWPAAIGLVDDDELAALPGRARAAHKWSSAVAVVAGSPGMEGAAVLCARGASRAGAGMVRLGVPGGGASPWPLEAVRMALPAAGWSGPVLAGATVPVVADADALAALGDPDDARRLIGASDRPVVLTPHDGEYHLLAGQEPGPDRVGAARRLAEATGAVVLLKGPTTAVADPQARRQPAVLLATAGSPALATAGSGGVLAGMIGAFLARGADPLLAAGLAAHVHGRAAGAGRAEGLVAPDLPDLVADWLSAALGRG